MAEYSTKFIKKVEVAKDIFELYLEKPTGFSFAAGQFAQFRIPDGDTIVLRSYSIASTPQDHHLLFCTKMYPGGKASTYFQNAQENQEMKLIGPNGRFVCTVSAPLVLIATGAGIAPIMGILRDELENKKNQHAIKLLFGVRTQEDMFWHHELNMLHQSFPNFSHTITLSQPEGGWEGPVGRVTDHVSMHMDEASHFFLCGSVDMVKDVKQILTSKNIPSGNIHFEIF